MYKWNGTELRKGANITFQTLSCIESLLCSKPSEVFKMVSKKVFA
jgi:hypothetical protein